MAADEPRRRRGRQTATSRPAGRPRADGRAHLSREEVFGATARLVARHGFAGASIRMIAGEVGASTASIFNLFANKQALLNELIAWAASPAIEFHRALRALELTAPIALYKSLYEETRTVASADRDHASLFYLPELRLPEFGPAQAVRAEMVDHYAGLVRGGIATNAFRPVDAHFAAEQMFQLTETSILLRSADVPAPETQAAATADFVLRGLLEEPGQTSALADEAATIELEMHLPAIVSRER